MAQSGIQVNRPKHTITEVDRDLVKLREHLDQMSDGGHRVVSVQRIPETGNWVVITVSDD